jgi:cryptochrome
MSSPSAATKVVVYWFRKALRLSDSPSLVAAAACASAPNSVFLPVFVLDPWFADPARVSGNRYSFLLQCLRDVDASLRARGSRLLVLRGAAGAALPAALAAWRATHLFFEKDTEPYAVARDAAVSAAARALGCAVLPVHGHTLWEPAALAAAARARGGAALPGAYASFCALAASLPPPPRPAPAPGALPPLERGAAALREGWPAARAHEVPVTLQEAGYPAGAAATTPFVGGEAAAAAALDAALARGGGAWAAAFSKPDTAPTALPAARSTTGLSPHMKFGSLGSRAFYWRLRDAVAAAPAGATRSQPPVSLEGQLLWREYAYALAAETANFDRVAGNPRCRQIAWDDDPALLAAWEAGRTGYPWIDACMAELHATGFLHHLGRHAVACFLTRGDLYQSWERGAKVFDRLLVDADYAINNFSWQWLSASAWFHQFWKVYSPVAFPKKTDPGGAYVRHWLPRLARLPDKYIYEPWLAPPGVLAAAGVRLGDNYPHRIIDHAVASKECIARLTLAYKAAPAPAPAAGAGAAAASAAGAAAPARPTRRLAAPQIGSHPAAHAAYEAAAADGDGGDDDAAAASAPPSKRRK